MKYEVKLSDDHRRLALEIKTRCGVDLAECYQCGECTAGCPMTPEMDAGPTKTLRLIQLGMEEALFSLNTPWLCSSCETCTTRCPQNVDIALVMDVVRQMARLRGIKPAPREPVIFQDVFLDSMRTYGKLHESGLIAFYNLKSGHLFNDVGLGPPMLMRGKLNVKPHRSKNSERLREIFRRAEDYEKNVKTPAEGDGHSEEGIE